MIILSFGGGLILLILGAEALVRGASRLAARVGVSSLVIGLTVVAFGTSAPELAVSLEAARSGQAAIAVGNVVGSNIFNVLFILGLSALITPLVVAQQLVRVEAPLIVGVSILVWAMGLDGSISRLEGLLLVLGLLVYTWRSIQQSRRESRAVKEEYERQFGQAPPRGSWVLQGTLVAAGLALLVIGSNWLLEGAIPLARYLGVSELVIGLTLVSAGTSLPEVVTSVVASVRGERDIAVGNVLGSNLFNLLGVLGLSAGVATGGIAVSDALSRFDLLILIGAAIACLPIFFTGQTISRWEGALLLIYYVAYTLYLILSATQHDRLPWFSGIMLYFFIPITVISLGVVMVREWPRRKARVH